MGQGLALRLSCAVSAIALLVAGCGTRDQPNPPTPKPVTHSVDFSGSIFTPEPVVRTGVLSSERMYKMYSGHAHWPAGVIAQYGMLIHPPQRPGAARANPPVAVWAVEAIGLCQTHGLSGATPGNKYCRTWDIVNAATGRGVLSVGP